ncbi:MAG: hypothetical protein IJK05_09775 [Bacteroidales bacterium]|nr:hypothetical protein [Bacteroidales bacterium]
MVAIISADIVRSTSLGTREQLDLRDKLRGLFEVFETDFPGFWARIVRGDSIECYVPEYRYALRIAILIKLFVKIQARKYDCAEQLLRHGIRFSIGVADIDYASKMDDMINGPAIYIAGRNLDAIDGRSTVFTSFELDNASKSVSLMLDSYVALVGNLVDSYSAKQSEVIFYKLRGYKEVEIAAKLGLSQSAVNMRSSFAQWNLLNEAILDFENLNFDKLCG